MHNQIMVIKVTFKVLTNGRRSCLKSALNPIKNPIKGNAKDAIPYHTFKNLCAVYAPNFPSQFFISTSSPLKMDPKLTPSITL